jgi:hypothetical protein
MRSGVADNAMSVYERHRNWKTAKKGHLTDINCPREGISGDSTPVGESSVTPTMLNLIIFAHSCPVCRVEYKIQAHRLLAKMLTE